MDTLNILVPTDLSEFGNKAFHTAEKIRRSLNGVITPMHTFKEIIWPDGISMPNIEDVLSDDIKNQVAQRLNFLAIEYSNEEHIDTPIITYGDPFNRILSESKNFDMVVMTTHGRRGVQKALLGSVAEKMIRNSQTPVVVTRGELREDSLDVKRILMTTDFSMASLKAIPITKEIMSNTDARLTILHIVSLEHTGTMQEGRKLAQKAELKLQDIKQNYFSDMPDRVQSEVEVTTNSPQVAIHKVISNRNFDLLSLSTMGKSALKYMMIGSNAASLIRSAPCPVLIVQPEK